MSKSHAKECLEKWENPGSYSGPCFRDYYVVYSRNRDSSILENVNYDIILNKLESVAKKESIEFGDLGLPLLDVRQGHWAVGWIELILVREYAPDCLLDLARDFCRALDDYPCLDEDRWSQAQFDAMYKYWEGMPLRCRIDECKEVRASIFAARHDVPPPKLEDAWLDSSAFH